MDLYAVKYPGLPWTLDPTGELRAANVVGMRVARMVELRDTPARVAATNDRVEDDKWPVFTVCFDEPVHQVMVLVKGNAAIFASDDETYTVFANHLRASQASLEAQGATLDAPTISDVPPAVDPARNGCEATKADCVRCMTGECREEGRG